LKQKFMDKKSITTQLIIKLQKRKKTTTKKIRNKNFAKSLDYNNEISVHDTKN
jgi:hypothetical protein